MTERPGVAHNNNFGALRLILAYAVIVSHSPEMLDGNSLREPFTALGLHFTLGGLAVDGFFIISGYLIASSYLSSRSLIKFLTSRVLRIYPAFLVAYLICVFLVGPTGGGSLGEVGARTWLFELVKMISLAPPELPGAFHTLPIPALDGSMWTISYEFRCYLLVAVLGILGLLDRRKLILSLTAAFYAVDAYFSFFGTPSIPRGHLHQLVFGLFGDPALTFDLTAIFMCGVCARLYREKLQFRPLLLLLSLAALFALAGARSPIPQIAIGTAGAYFLLWAAIGLKSRALQSVNNSYDFSYGVYLYAWPVASLVMLVAQQLHIGLAPIALTAVTAVFATLIGAASWYVIERPALGLKLRQPASLQMATP